MLLHFQRFIQAENLDSSKDRILVAVSGGADSVVLAHLFKKNEFKLALAHVNYGKRGEDSNQDESLVRDLAKTWNVPFYCIRYHEEGKGGNFQDKARKFRYQWFSKLMHQHGYNKLAVAQHADDQIETFLLHLFRSSGLDGLSGIKKQDGSIIRPLLDVFKSEIYEYARINNIHYREDRSNAESLYARNQIRNLIIPHWEELFPNIKNQMLASVSHLQDAAQLLHFFLEKATRIDKELGSIKIYKLPLEQAPAPPKLLYFLMKPYGFTSSQAKDLYGAASGSLGETEGYLATVEKSYIRLFPRTHLPIPFHVELAGYSTVELPHGWLTVRPYDYGSCNETEVAMVLSVSGSDLFPIQVTNYFTGQTIAPAGMKGKSKTIKKFLADSHLDLWQRKRAIIIKSKGQVAGVFPYRAAEGFHEPNVAEKVEFIFSPKE